MKELKSTEGMYLTQVAEVGEERIFITKIKGMNVKEEDWRDATLEEKEAFEKAKEEAEKANQTENLDER